MTGKRTARTQYRYVMEIRSVLPPGDAAWDAYVRSHPDGTLFHESAWTCSVTEAYRHAPLLLAAWRGSRIAGVLPLFHVKSWLFGSRLVSPAFGIYGGILADDPDIAVALATAARDAAAERGAKYVELRSRRALFAHEPVKDLYWTFRIPVAKTFEATLAAFPKKVRQDLRRLDQKGFRFEEQNVPTRSFYELYLHTLRWHGTPPFPMRWFEALRRNFGDRCIVLAGYEPERGRRAGASMLFRDRDSLIPYYSGVPREFYKQRAVVAMHAKMLRMASDAGLSVLDLGRSKAGTGAYDAKTHWGFEPEPLGYQFLLPEGARVPDLSPANPKFQPLIAIWKRLPLAATRVLGPPLNASLA